MNFEQQFNSFYPILVGISKRYARTTSVPYEEYESALSEEFFLKYESFDPDVRDNFNAFMRVVLTQRATRVANRRERDFYDNVVFYEGFDEDGEDEGFDVVSDWKMENHVEDLKAIKTDADKLELISALTETSDSVTKKIVREFLSNENANPTAIGKALGIHHQVVIRKLGYLSRNFTENKFGEVGAYLAV